MKILLTGADGQVGREFPDLVNSIDDAIELASAGRNKLDITQKDKILEVVDSIKPDIIVNAAAYTAVDRAEEEFEKAFAVNRDAAENLAVICEKKHIPLIHISTDYVFDGEKPGEYVETDQVNPKSVYGQSKLEGEQRIQDILDRHIILRTSWVFGPYGKNFVYTMIRLAKQKKELSVVNDQTGCPTSANSIAGAILTMSSAISNGDDANWGIYHYCGTPATNWFEFCRAIIENSKQNSPYSLETIKPISTSEYPTAATRPKNSVLNCDKIRDQYGIHQQPWVNGLNEMFNHPQFIMQSTQ